MNLSKNFTLEELTRTEVRAYNTCPQSLMQNLQATADMLERIRAALSASKGMDIPILVTSCYRSALVNKAVGGQPTSDHMQAQAVDFVAPKFGTPYQIGKFLASQREALGIGQVIHEFGRWVHCSTKTPDKPVNRVITISASGVQAGIVEVT